MMVVDASNHTAGGTAISGPEAALASLHYAYPITVFTFYIVTTLIAATTLQQEGPQNKHIRRGLILFFAWFAVLSYVAQFSFLLVRSFLAWRFLGEQHTVIGLLSSILVFGVLSGNLAESENPIWHPYLGAFGLALVFDPAIQTLTYITSQAAGPSIWPVIETCTVAARCFCFILALSLYAIASRSAAQEDGTDAEQQSLLDPDGEANSEASGSSGEASTSNYGSTASKPSAGAETSTNGGTTSQGQKPESSWERRNREGQERIAAKLKENGNWFSYTRRFMVFLPYIWPLRNRPLQIRIVLVGICLLAKNAVNLLIPRQLGIVLDTLNKLNGLNPWVQVVIYAGLRLVASEAGLSLLRQWLWLPVEYYAFDAMSTAAYSHVLNLSSDFHDTKSSSDIMMAIQSGQSVSNMLESICFSAVPMLIDMVVAFIYLSAIFGPYEAFITTATAIVFLAIATRMISKLKEARRGEIGAFFEEHYVRQAGIQGWSTVTCFNQVGHEETRYSTAVKNRVSKSQKVYVGYLFTYAFQFLVLLSGLLAGAFLAVYQISQNKATPGDFIMLLTYWAQLIGPLHYFANMGKNISRDLIHAEQLLEIMQTKPSVRNKEGAKALELPAGRVSFKDVCFSYDKQKEILKKVSFEVEPGTTVAFVGTTGAGKSTILKLLDRFYDVSDGSITIDGQDIRDVDIYSLRSHVGVVPQTPILFDDTIINNVRYARLSATDEEVYEACRAASIHEQIETFTDGYETRVGERGIKLSGGELQRIAIARAILKRPSIVLLDEATSAVDTETEQRIQEALRSLCQGRTTFIVAHRLSTIMNADRIIVVSGGEVIEQGTHDSLIKAGGKYADLWSKQIFTKAKAKAKDEDEDTDEEDAGVGSKSPTIVNDLTPEEAAELTKVDDGSTRAPTPTPETSNTTESDGDRPDEGEGAADQTPERGESGHRKEGSKLNPDAPTFTPRSTPRSTPAARADRSPSEARLERSGDGYYDGAAASQRRHMPMQPVQYFAAPMMMIPATYRFFQPAFSHLSTPRDPNRVATVSNVHDNETSETRVSAARAESNDPSTDLDTRQISESTQTELKTPRYSRRVQSKSEPFSATGSPPSP